ncbi:gliding motility-associated C-terminal domain-containing protein [Lacibacter sp.]|uniref:T9SS type B sorting domain-containing protein n=1 Tax=Lacibacter sp. TaxID=1915409 RepID=UPI002B4B5935|nr:gliding motility-associated C-terminal domain-containing protein [Lacibacter sp.]HLP36927.1 gliding motility-associated C-terminal domain-containing protein [Lacibacter sp.]
MNPKNPISFTGTILFLLLSFFSQAQSFGTFASARSANSNQSDYTVAGFSPNVFDNASTIAFTLGDFPLLSNWNLTDDQITTANNHAFFAPTISSSNPTTCNGTDGSVTINGLIPGTSYDINYTDDGNAVGPVAIVANGAGQATITGLNAGVYAGFTITENGNTTNLFSGVILSNPIIVPSFTAIPPFCSGTTAPILPTTSNNGLTGTWSPATVSNTASGSYTFTPAPGQCGLPVTINITVTPRTTPTFSFTTSICEGATAPVLPSTSNNGVNGAWSPSLVSNTASGSYTFTPDPGVCANPVTINVTVTPNVTPSFSFATSICEGVTAPVLPPTSNNGVNGTWSPSTVSNTASGSYTFTPTAGQCANPVTINVTVTPNVTPTFSFATNICEGATAPGLPSTSDNGVTGTWSPATVSNSTSGSYTFTPTAGLCALPVTINVTVTPNVTPTFSFATTICNAATAPILPTTSDNGVTGTWSPSTVSNTASGSYTFTPTAGLCALPVTVNVTVTPNVTPTFSFTTSICEGATAPLLPTTSDNGVTGTWSPSTVSNTASGSYTFTPTAGLCALPVTVNVTVTPNVTPTFSFATTICSGATAPLLPTTSDNGVTGTWSPSTVSNTASGSYTFTPTAGLCALPVTVNVTVTPNVTPTFSFATTICSGATAPLLPTTSDNGVTGTWSPSTVSNTASGSYTFTPTAGLCALPVTINVTVSPNVTPTFSFATSICEGATAPALPLTSNNGVTGTWSPSTVSNTTSGSYTFTPTAGLCALPVTVNVTVNPILAPTFSFGATLSICNGSAAPALPNTSTNGIAGTWSPATISNTTSGTYTFTPNAGQCGTSATLNVTVVANTVPTFSFGTTLTICSGGTVPALPNTSDNGVSGTWSPSTVSNTANGTYTFTPTAGVCATTQTFTVTVNPIVTPTFSFGTTASICVGAAVQALPTTSVNNITGTWTPATVSSATAGTTIYTFTPTAGQCAVAQTYTVEVSTVPTVTVPANITVNDGTLVPATNFTITPAGASVTWTNSNPAIGLAASGTGNVPQFTATNSGNTDITATITVTPRNNGCIGTPRTYTITVKALDKGVFVPNVFSPNNDGKNDRVMIYGNYINKVEMRIFNQWGQQVAFLNSQTQGWDGTHKGKPQPVGVYVYALRAVMTDGRTVDLKGSITLVR